MMNAIGSQKESLARAVAELPDFMRNFNTTAVNLRATLDDLDPLVDASKPVATRLRPVLRRVPRRDRRRGADGRATSTRSSSAAGPTTTSST